MSTQAPAHTHGHEHDEQLSDEERHFAEKEERVTPLELFFDLIFVFAITQVTRMLVEQPDWTGLGRGLLVLAVMWWAWTGYAWLTNEVDPENGRIRLAILAAMAAMLIASVAIPQAFGDEALLFGIAYAFVRAAHIVLFGLAPNDVGIQAAARRLAPAVLVACTLLIAAAFVDGTAQAVFWLAAIAIDYGGVVATGSEGWHVHPNHFAERHGLIIIIALGEAIIATGATNDSHALPAGVVIATVLAIVVAGSLWWAYFDVVAIVAQRKLGEATGAERNRMARDSYSYLHFVMIAGIVLLAFGVKKTLAGVHDPLPTVPALSLCGGVALYLLGHIAFRLRNVRTLNRQRLVAAVACLALIPLATSVDALAALAAVAAVCVVLISYEAIRFREARARVRGSAA